MVEFIKVSILGFVEGITEFLPISSTGHLLVASAFLNSEISNRLGGTFEIFIQIGAVIAVIVYYRKDLFDQARSFTTDRSVRQLWLNIVIASIPAGLIGFLTRDLIKEKLFPQDTAPLVVAVALISGGIVFIGVEKRIRSDAFKTDQLSSITITQALLIGFAQILALIPGVSRSGATIIGALLVGVSRTTATAFSFYLAIPVLGGATTIDLLLSANELTRSDLAYLTLGAVVSGIVAWISIGWLLRFVSSHSFISFGYYRIIIGIVILLCIAAGIV